MTNCCFYIGGRYPWQLAAPTLEVDIYGILMLLHWRWVSMATCCSYIGGGYSWHLDAPTWAVCNNGSLMPLQLGLDTITTCPQNKNKCVYGNLLAYNGGKSSRLHGNLLYQ